MISRLSLTQHANRMTKKQLTLEAFTEQFSECIGFEDLKQANSPFTCILKSKFLSVKNAEETGDIENDVGDELADDISPEICLQLENL